MMHAGRRETLYTSAPSVQATSAGEPLFARAHRVREDCELRARRLRLRLHSPTLSVSRSRGHSKRPLFRFSLPARSSCLPVRTRVTPPATLAARHVLNTRVHSVGASVVVRAARTNRHPCATYILTHTTVFDRPCTSGRRPRARGWVQPYAFACLLHHPCSRSGVCSRLVRFCSPTHVLPCCKPIGSRTNIP